MPRTSHEDEDRPDISLIIPAHNEASHIAGMLEEIAQWTDQTTRRVEVIIADDGSSDGTSRVAQSRGEYFPFFQLVRSQQQRGKGAALGMGVARANANIVALIDGDDSFPPSQLGTFIAAIEDGADVVIGNRRRAGSIFLVAPATIPYIHLRHFVGLRFNDIVRLLTRLPFRDTQCGLKLFRASVARRCFSKVRVGGFVFDLELLLAAAAAGDVITEVPATVRHRDTDPVWRIAHLSTTIGLDLLKVAYNQQRGLYR